MAKLHPMPEMVKSPTLLRSKSALLDGPDEAKRTTLSDLSMSLPVATRLNDKQTSGLLGKCTRSPISGTPRLKNATIMGDFKILDLWERTALYGQPDDLIRDPYVFKIVPLPLRTWLYHTLKNDIFLIARTKGENGLIEMVLNYKVIDKCDRIDGRWSPFVCSVPTVFASILSIDWATALACIVMCAFNLTVSKLCNTPRWFKFARLFSLVPRILFFAYVCIRMGSVASKSAVSSLAFMVIIGFLLGDFILGDFMALRGWGMRSSYEVLRVLPNRIFICRKHGGAFYPDVDHGRNIHDAVTGCGFFDELVIIAEVRGLVVQLKPMDKEDWVMAWEERTNTDRPIPFIGLDVFNRERRSVHEIEESRAVSSGTGARDVLIAKLERGDAPELIT